MEAQEYWSELPIPSAGDLPNPGIEPGFPALQVDFYQQSYQGSLSMARPPFSPLTSYQFVCSDGLQGEKNLVR